MKRIFRSSSFLAACAIACIVALDAAPAFSQGRYPPFLMGIQPNGDEYWVGEPILVKCRLVNWLSPTVQVEAFFGVQGVGTEFYVVQDGKWKDPYRSFHEVEPVSEQTFMMQYAKAHEFSIPVLYDPKGADNLALSQSGEYQFRLVQTIYYMNMSAPLEGKGRRVLEAFSRTVKVVEPPEEFAGALEMLKSRPSTFLDLNRQIANPANKQLFETLVREYPKSHYAPYCLHALAALETLFVKTHYDFLEKAVRLYERLVNEYPDYPLRDVARIRLAELLSRTGNLDKAVGVVYQLLAESGDNLYRFRRSPLMKPLRNERGNPYGSLTMHCWDLFGVTELTDAGFQLAVEPEIPDGGGY